VDLGLRDKGVVITGGSRGIGRAACLAFAREGAHVALCARTPEALERTAGEIRSLGVKVYAAACDVADAPALDAFLDGAHQALGRVDVLVNNASGFGMGDDEAAWRLAVDVDLLASVRASRRVVPWMEAAGGGAIVHVASTLGGLEADHPAPAAYATLKGALVSHSKLLALALADKRIRVNCIAPGSIDFPGGVWEQIRRAQPALYERVLGTIPWGRMGAADEVADAIVFLASARASWITGAVLPVDGGQHKGNL
jgi:3-oxoacyl-[acyl-carrier protein] reductase